MKRYPNKMLQKLHPKKDLIVRMSLWLIGSVAVVTCLILILANVVMSRAYDRELRRFLTDYAEATINAVDLRMGSVWSATQTAALLASDELQDTTRIDIALIRTINGMRCVNAVAAVYRQGFFDNHTEGNYLRVAYIDNESDGQPIKCRSITSDKMTTDPNWIHSFEQGKGYMSVPYFDHNTYLVTYSVPLANSKRERYGMLCVSIKLNWMAEIASDLRPNNNINVAIFAENGASVVEPSDLVKKLAETDPDALICEQRLLPALGWTVQVAIPRQVIDKSLNRLTAALAVVLLILLLCTSTILLLVVRYIGRPFAKEQKQTLEAKAAIQRELDIAASTQRELVPHTFPPFPTRKDLDLHACLLPALEVAGDLYDYYIQENRLYFCIGDVSGKGLPASLFMAATRYLFRSVADSMPMADAVRQMNRSLCADNTQCMFVTFWMGCLDLKTGVLEYVNAGHNSPILLQTENAHYLPMADDMPLGAWEEAEFTTRSLTLSPGDKLLLYTDGVTEAMDAQGHELGNNQTLQATTECLTLTAKDTINHLLQRVRQHAANATQSDDITMLCIGYQKNA